jgi:CRP-like cAMP-binding protein
VEQLDAGPHSLLRPGEFFGEIGLLAGKPRSATVRALTPVTVASCDRAAFERYVRPLFDSGPGREILERRLDR